MKKLMRITLYEGGNLADALALLCCKNNGTKDKMTIADLESWFKGYKMQYPSLADGFQLHPFPNSFTLDHTNYKGETRCVLAVEEIEVMELNPVLAAMDEYN
jgi:hypothetical protein